MIEGKKGVRPWMILMATTRMSSKVKRIKLHWTVKVGSCQGEKGVVEVSEQVPDGKMGLTEA